MSDSAIVGLISIVVAIIVGIVTWKLMTNSSRQQQAIRASMSKSMRDKIRLDKLKAAHETGPKITVSMHDADDLEIALTRNIEFINNKPVSASLISYRIAEENIFPQELNVPILPAPADGLMPNRTRWEFTEPEVLRRIRAILNNRSDLDSVSLEFVFQGANGFKYITKREYVKDGIGRWLKQPPDPDFQPITE